MSEESDSGNFNWATAFVLSVFLVLMGSIMYFDYSCTCNGCRDYSCKPPEVNSGQQ